MGLNCRHSIPILIMTSYDGSIGINSKSVITYLIDGNCSTIAQLLKSNCVLSLNQILILKEQLLIFYSNFDSI